MENPYPAINPGEQVVGGSAHRFRSVMSESVRITLKFVTFSGQITLLVNLERMLERLCSLELYAKKLYPDCLEKSAEE